jgi:hypothetical protein
MSASLAWVDVELAAKTMKHDGEVALQALVHDIQACPSRTAELDAVMRSWWSGQLHVIRTYMEAEYRHLDAVQDYVSRWGKKA